MNEADRLSRKLLEVCRLCEAGRAAMSPADRDAQSQLFLAQAVGRTGRLRAAPELREAGMNLRRMREEDAPGGVAT
ncbi:MAG: hypothetical protein ACPMAQ_10495 [Phycisphaerae bacterium]